MMATNSPYDLSVPGNGRDLDALGVPRRPSVTSVPGHARCWLRYSEFLEFGASVTSVLLNARSHVRNKVLAGELAAKLVKAKTIGS
jgi:hypothetical protein